MHLTLFVRKYRQTYRQLCLKLYRALCLQLNPALNLNLNLNLYPSSYDEMFAALYEKMYASLFAPQNGALYRKNDRSLFILIDTGLLLAEQPPRRPLPYLPEARRRFQEADKAGVAVDSRPPGNVVLVHRLLSAPEYCLFVHRPAVCRRG